MCCYAECDALRAIWTKATHCRQAHIDRRSHFGAKRPHFIRSFAFFSLQPETIHYLISIGILAN